MNPARFVAPKVLSDALARDPPAYVGFTPRGRAAAALNHANLCTIYEVGEQEGGRVR